MTKNQAQSTEMVQGIRTIAQNASEAKHLRTQNTRFFWEVSTRMLLTTHVWSTGLYVILTERALWDRQVRTLWG
jgi:hypothetical protein